jgi:hypothetical protein
MATVQGTQGPDVQTEALPTPFASAPPPSTAPFAVGAALEETASQIGAVAQHEYQLAINEKKDAATAKYLDGGADILSAYRGLSTKQAMAAHPAVVQKLQDLRDQLAQSIGSRRGADEFADSSANITRILRSGIESHFSQERKANYTATLNDLSAAYTKTIGNLTAMGAHAEALIPATQEFERHLRENASLQGLSDEETDALVQKRMLGPATAILHAASAPGTSQTAANIQKLVDTYGQYAPNGVKGAEDAILSKQVDEKVQGILNVPRVNAAGEPDDSGLPNEVEVKKNLLEALKSTPDEHERELLDKRVRQQMDIERGIQSDTAKQIASKVSAQAQLGKGFDLDRVNPSDIEDLRKTAPDLLRTYQKADEGEKAHWASQARRDAKDLSDINMTQFQADLTEMAKTDSQKFTDLKPTDLHDLMLKLGYEPGSFTAHALLTEAPNLLKKLQEQHKTDDLTWTTKAATQALQPIFPHYMQLGGGGAAAIRNEPIYGQLLKDLTGAVRADGTLKTDPVKLKKFIDAKIADGVLENEIANPPVERAKAAYRPDLTPAELPLVPVQ